MLRILRYFLLIVIPYGFLFLILNHRLKLNAPFARTMLPGWEIVFELSATMIYVFLLILLSLWARNDYGKKVLLILFIVGTLISIGVTIGLSLQITSPYYLLAYPIISVPISFYLGNLVFLVIYTKVEKSRPSS